MKKVEQYHSDDYAGLEVGNLQFYFGYEHPDPTTEEWVFIVEKEGQEVFSAPTSEIEEKTDSRQLHMPQDYLVAGIGLWLNQKNK